MEGSVAIVGATGMLGRAVTEALGARDCDVRVFDRRKIDLADPASIARLPTDVDWVINCAAFTDVDRAERQPELATVVNGRAVGVMGERCREIGATLVTFGTDYVFDGTATRPYRVDHPQAPLNAYGRSKALGERLLDESGAQHLLIRTSWLYAPWGRNFVLTMAALTRDRDELRVVSDQRGRPTSARHLARATLALADAGAEGAFHVADGGECSWYELACVVRDHLGHRCAIEPCASDEFPRPARRPAYGVLDVTKAESVIGPMPLFRQSVAAALDDAQRAESTS